MKKVKKSILPVMIVVAFFLTAFNFIACTIDPAVGDGSECTYCNTNADCKDGMSCKFFSSTTAFQTKSANLCASSSTRTCSSNGY